MDERIGNSAILSAEEYDKLIAERDFLDARIKEYESEHRRGSVKVIRTKGGYDRKVDVFSVRYDKSLGETIYPHWKTLITKESISDIIKFLDTMARDIPAVLDAIKNENKEEDEEK